METLIYEIGGISIVPTYFTIRVRGKHSEKWKGRSICHCSICDRVIEIGDHYIVRNNSSVNDTAYWCLNCVKIMPGDEFFDLSL